MDVKISKDEVRKRIALGQAMHADWMAKVELVTRGVYKPNYLQPVLYSQSECGLLFQSFPEEFYNLPRFTAIVTPLEGLYNMYIEIYEGLTSKRPIFTNQEKWTLVQIEKYSDTYNRMEEVTETLYGNIDRFVHEYNTGNSIG